MSGREAVDRQAGLRAVGLAGGDPAAGGLVHPLHDVLVDGLPAVVRRWVPRQLGAVRVHIRHLRETL